MLVFVTMRCYFYLTIFSAYILTFNAGVLLFWLSPIIPKLTSVPPENPLPEPVTTGELSIFVSISALGSITAPLLAFATVNIIGVKVLLLVANSLTVVALLTAAFADHIAWYFFSRFIGGVVTSLTASMVAKYLVEISDTRLRGTIGTLAAFTESLGAVAALSVGPFTTVMVYNLVLLSAPCMFFIVWFFIPESPNILLQKGNVKEALKVLEDLQFENAAEHLNSLRDICDSAKKVPFKTVWSSKYNIKALSIVTVLLMLQQLTGTKMLTTFTQSILEDTITVLSPEICAIIIALLGTIVSPINPLFVDRLGRKIIIATSLVLVIVSTLVLGFHFQFGGPSWVSLAFLMIFKVAHTTGLSINMCWLIMLEVLPNNIKTIAIPIAHIMNILMNYLVSSMIPYVNEAFGVGVTFWMFTVFALVMLMHVVFLIPETKGKGPEELEHILKK